MSEQDLSNTDVFKMTMECGLNIFHIYEALGLPYDSTTQRIFDQLEAAKTPEEWQLATNMKFRYLQEMGDRPHGVITQARSLTKEEVADLKRRIAEKDYIALISTDPAIRAAQLRVRTGIPWGTPLQMDKVRIDAKTCDLQGLLRLYKSTPSDASHERAIVLRLIALRFFQKPAASP